VLPRKTLSSLQHHEQRYVQVPETSGISLHAVVSEERSTSTLSGELQRRTVEGLPDAKATGLALRSARSLCRPRRKLVESTEPHEVVVDMMRKKCTRQQISGTRKAVFPHHPGFQVLHETV